MADIAKEALPNKGWHDKEENNRSQPKNNKITKEIQYNGTRERLLFAPLFVLLFVKM